MYEQGKSAGSIDCAVWMERGECVSPENADGVSDATTKETEAACEAPALHTGALLAVLLSQLLEIYQ